MDGVPASRVGLQPGSPLLSSIRHCSVELARNSEVLHTIQSAAQGVLKSGWMMLLPTVSERAAALSQLLHFGDGTCVRYVYVSIIINIIINITCFNAIKDVDERVERWWYITFLLHTCTCTYVIQRMLMLFLVICKWNILWE